MSAYNNLIFFGKLFLPGDFNKSRSPLFHYEIGGELISDSVKPLAIILPRGHAKTTVVKAKIIHDFCFAKKAYEWGFADKPRNLFIGWVSISQRKSQNNVQYVKLNLEWNERINFYFGKPPLNNVRGSVWNQEDIFTAYDDRLLSSSNLTTIRGDTQATIHAGALRYSYVICDDVESEENTRTHGARGKIADNILNGILPAIEKNEPGCRLIVIGTPVHYDSFIQNILDKWDAISDDERAMENFSWKVITHSVNQPNLPGGVLWEEWMPRSVLERIRKEYAESSRGESGYFQEYELKVQSSENSLWNANNIKYWNGYYLWDDEQNFIVINGERIPVTIFIGCDPATDIETKDSDFSVIIVIAVDSRGDRYVLDYERHRSIPTIATRDESGSVIGKFGVVDYIINLYIKYHADGGAVEDVAMNRSIFQSLNSERRRLNRWDINLIPEKPGGRDKINRIYSGLNSLFGAGAIYVKDGHHELIGEIIKFGPRMAHDDTIEALYYANRYAYPPSAGMFREITGEFKKKIKRAKNWVIA